MRDFIKELTVIDFLGILLPGSFLILLLSLDFPQISLLKNFFGVDPGMGVKVTVLLVVGYFVGMLIYEIGDWIEKLMWKCDILDPKTYAIKAMKIETWKKQQEVFENLRSDEVRKMPIDDVVKAVRKYNSIIQTQVYGRGSFAKRQIFDGFRLIMRNQLIAFAIIGLYICAQSTGALRQEISGILSECWERMMLLGGVTLMIVRYYHYAYLKYKYSFEDWLELKQHCTEKSKDNVA